VEKVLGSSAPIDDLLVRRYYALKAAHGYTAEQIERKRLALEGVLVPVAARSNEDLMRDAGFDQIDCFWRWCNFAGWIALKN
jgi:tRNA (cmo5U34)-methyltransferase